MIYMCHSSLRSRKNAKHLSLRNTSPRGPLRHQPARSFRPAYSGLCLADGGRAGGNGRGPARRSCRVSRVRGTAIARHASRQRAQSGARPRHEPATANVGNGQAAPFCGQGVEPRESDQRDARLPAEAKYEMEDGSVYSSAKGFDTPAEDNSSTSTAWSEPTSPGSAKPDAGAHTRHLVRVRNRGAGR